MLCTVIVPRVHPRLNRSLNLYVSYTCTFSSLSSCDFQRRIPFSKNFGVASTKDKMHSMREIGVHFSSIIVVLSLNIRKALFPAQSSKDYRMFLHGFSPAA